MPKKMITADDYKNIINVPLEGIQDVNVQGDYFKSKYSRLISDNRFQVLLISELSLQKRIENLAKKIINSNLNKTRIDILFVLTGAFIFAADLSREIYKCGGPEVYFHIVKLSTYQDEIKKAGEIARQVKFELTPIDVENRDIIIVEDIVDQGFTLNALNEYLLNKKHVNSVKICSLLLKKLDNPSEEVKQSRKNIESYLDFIGFTVPEIWVAGYGIDASSNFRSLPFIIGVNQEYYLSK